MKRALVMAFEVLCVLLFLAMIGALVFFTYLGFDTIFDDSMFWLRNRVLTGLNIIILGLGGILIICLHIRREMKRKPPEE